MLQFKAKSLQPNSLQTKLTLLKRRPIKRAKGEKLEEEGMGIKAQLKVHGTRLHELEERIEQIEREKRRNILVIDGLIEKEGEKANELLDGILKDLKEEFAANVCTAVFRRGKAPTDNGERPAANHNNAQEYEVRPRRLVVIFPSVAEKAAVFRNLKNLQGLENRDKVYFNDNVTETQANEQ